MPAQLLSFFVYRLLFHMGAILTSPDWTVIQKDLNHDFYPDFCNIKKKNQ